MHHPTTIYALASTPGKAGVAVVRISGPAAPAALVCLGVVEPLKPRHATLVTLMHQGAALDRALALAFPAPHSFTGEDVVELHTHGSRAVARMLLEALGSIPGLRLAEPGEFTRRAFMHGKLDLLEAEGLADLIDADSPAQHAQAMRQLGGELSARVMGLREQILTPLALLEAYIDFPDEEIPEAVLEETSQRIATLIKQLEELLKDGGIGEKIREGLRIVIFGPPNAGKSSLMNAIAKRDVAIVSPEAGTTRDLIEIQLEIGGFAATLTDTAGLREATGSIEAEGVRRAHDRIASADLKLAVFDSITMSEQMSEFSGIMDDHTVIIANKVDLLQSVGLCRYQSDNEDEGLSKRAAGSVVPSPLRGGLGRGASNEEHSLTSPHLTSPARGEEYAGSRLPSPPLPISAKTGDGLDALFATLKARIESLAAAAPSPLITRARHREAFTAALAALTRFSAHAPLELACEELRHAATAVGKITGKISTDDLLDVVFRRFCIGK